MKHRLLCAAGCGLALVGLGGFARATERVDACVDFGCKHQTPAQLSDAAWQRITRLFAGVDSAAAERAAVAAAIARFETEVGRQTGTWRDLGENWQRAGEPGELDCIAESRNTTAYLKLLQDAGLLRWHRLQPREKRGVFFVHWTAVLRQNADGSRWAVDSWFRANGKPPVILPLAQWYHYSGPEQ